VLRIAEFGKGLLEILNHRAADETGSVKGLAKYAYEFLFQLNMWSN
jgi:hypothetical protein